MFLEVLLKLEFIQRGVWRGDMLRVAVRARWRVWRAGARASCVRAARSTRRAPCLHPGEHGGR